MPEPSKDESQMSQITDQTSKDADALRETSPILRMTKHAWSSTDCNAKSKVASATDSHDLITDSERKVIEPKDTSHPEEGSSKRNVAELLSLWGKLDASEESSAHSAERIKAAKEPEHNATSEQVESCEVWFAYKVDMSQTYANLGEDFIKCRKILSQGTRRKTIPEYRRGWTVLVPGLCA